MLSKKNRRGTALVEFVMCIPLLAFVIAATFFFGWAMRNQQRVRVADRYAAWSGLHGRDVTADELNERFFGGKGLDITITTDAGPTGTLDDFIETAESQDPHAGELAGELIEEGYMPRGRADEVSSRFATSMALWRRLGSGAIRSRHAREGLSWRRSECSPAQAVRDLYLHELDSKVADTAGEQVGESLRSLYMQGW